MPMLVKEMYNCMVDNLNGAEPPYSLETVNDFCNSGSIGSMYSKRK